MTHETTGIPPLDGEYGIFHLVTIPHESREHLSRRASRLERTDRRETPRHLLQGSSEIMQLGAEGWVPPIPLAKPLERVRNLMRKGARKAAPPCKDFAATMPGQQARAGVAISG